ncbi:hypothetical protein I5938_00005 [Salmonella enterica subsp. enterica serovar Indiana]|nr:hypothetical protein [Salmonella enterica subsp. enterica serovar Indiana]
MKRSEIRKALEAWFDVERYEAIEKLSLQQFYVEIERRILVDLPLYFQTPVIT